MNRRVVIFSLTAVLLTLVINFFTNRVPDVPDLDLDRWWGVGSRSKHEDTAIRRFEVDFNDSMVQDLKERLRSHRPFTKTLQGIQSEYGINIVYLNKVIEYWTEKYDFKERAAIMNKFPHYKTKIQGLDIHFVRVRPTDTGGLKVLPLVLLHGWPSSSKEFHKVIPILTSPREEYDFIFEVIAVDLPGFGFSEGTNKPGLNPVQIGIIVRNLMRRLGFEKFYIQAGDWGSQCANHMATVFPDEVLGLHTNMPLSTTPLSNFKLLLGSVFPSLIGDPQHLERIYPLRDLFEYLIRESGYFHIQATKPDTIGVALTDSPAGLAAYLIEKMAVCTNRDQLHTPHGGLEKLDLDDVLDTITIAWTNNCIVTAMRIYAEGYRRSGEIDLINRIPTKVPTAAINFRYEVFYQPDWILRDKFSNLVRTTTLDFGGHFAALEVPHVLAADVFAATQDFLKFHANAKQ